MRLARDRLEFGWQAASQEAQPGATHDTLDVRACIAMGGEGVDDLAEVGDRVESVGGAFHAEAAVEVAAERAVSRVAREFADVVDMADHDVERKWRARFPGWIEKLVRQHGPDNGVALDQGADHIIAEVAVGWREDATVSVAGDDR